MFAEKDETGVGGEGKWFFVESEIFGVHIVIPSTLHRIIFTVVYFIHSDYFQGKSNISGLLTGADTRGAPGNAIY
jgi:hypothetical protein